MGDLNFQRYQFNFVTTTPLRLDFYAGSLLRGVFGKALRQLSCMTKLKSCPDCPLYRSCPYAAVFEVPPPVQHNLQKFSQIPSPYVIEPPPLGSKVYAVGELLSFTMILIGPAIAQLPLIVLAWQRAFAQGVGKYNSTAHLHSVTLPDANGHIIYNPQQDPAVLPHAALALAPVPQHKQVTLHFSTPLQLQKQGRLMGHNLTAKELLVALIRRYYLLAEFYAAAYQVPPFAELAEQARHISCSHQLAWCEWQRYSNRQQQKMRVDGVVGSICLAGDLTVFLPLLEAGQWLHIGNKTTFGMGRYTLQHTP